MCDIPTRWLLGDGAMGKKRLDSVGFVLPTGMLTKGEQPTERTVPPGGQADSPVRGDPHQGWEAVRKGGWHGNDDLGDSGAWLEGSNLQATTLALGSQVWVVDVVGWGGEEQF